MKSGKPQLENAIALVLPTAYGERMVFLYRLLLSASPWLTWELSARQNMAKSNGKFEFHLQGFGETLERSFPTGNGKFFRAGQPSVAQVFALHAELCPRFRSSRSLDPEMNCLQCRINTFSNEKHFFSLKCVGFDQKAILNRKKIHRLNIIALH